MSQTWNILPLVLCPSFFFFFFYRFILKTSSTAFCDLCSSTAGSLGPRYGDGAPPHCARLLPENAVLPLARCSTKRRAFVLVGWSGRVVFHPRRRAQSLHYTRTKAALFAPCRAAHCPLSLLFIPSLSFLSAFPLYLEFYTPTYSFSLPEHRLVLFGHTGYNDSNSGISVLCLGVLFVPDLCTCLPEGLK